jgi:hypothetical protein
MSKDKKDFEFEGVKYFVKRPTSKVSGEASRIYSVEFTKCIREGLMTKEKMKAFLLEHGVWTKEQEEKEKNISKQINELELEIYKSGPDRKRVSLKEGREKAIKIKELRNDYMNLISQRQSYESNTAESIADNARFDYLVSECTFKEDGTKVYNSYDDYQVKSNEDLAYQAASTLAQMIYALEDDYAKKLPENQFLSAFNLINEDLRLVDKDGNLVDKEGRRISKEGFYLDKDGNRVDINGNRLSEDGLFDLDLVYLDEDGNEIKPKSLLVEKAQDEVAQEVSSEVPLESVAEEPV